MQGLAGFGRFSAPFGWCLETSILRHVGLSTEQLTIGQVAALGVSEYKEGAQDGRHYTL